MIQFPSIQIHQQYARIGIDADLAKLEMSQPKASMELSTTKPKVDIQSSQGNLEIDQRKAWDALAVGNHLRAMDSIYSEIKNVVLRSIGRIASDGNYLAQIHKGHKFADIARAKIFEFPELAFAGEPSYDNVDVTYTANSPQYDFHAGTVDIEVKPNKPQIDAFRGKLDIYIQQYNAVEITPPQINLLL